MAQSYVKATLLVAQSYVIRGGIECNAAWGEEWGEGLMEKVRRELLLVFKVKFNSNELVEFFFLVVGYLAM